MSTFQKILLGIPILLYCCFTCWFSYMLHESFGFIFVLNILLPFALFVVFLFFSLTIHTLSIHHISVTGGAIISIWSFMILGGAWVFWEMQMAPHTVESRSHIAYENQWHREYGGREKIIDEEAKKYADANFYPGGRPSSYSQVLKEIADDPSRYVIYGFYCGQTAHLERPLLSVCMLTDTSGAVMAHCDVDLDNDTVALTIYKHWLACIFCADKMIHKEGGIPEGTHAMNADDSALVQADEALDRDTIMTRDLPGSLARR